MKQTKTLGIVTTSTNPFFWWSSKVGVERRCYEKGYNLILCNTEGDSERMKSSIDTLLQKRVDGSSLMCSTPKVNTLMYLNATQNYLSLWWIGPNVVRERQRSKITRTKVVTWQLSTWSITVMLRLVVPPAHCTQSLFSLSRLQASDGRSKARDQP